jgi:hypothetical protein
MRMHRFDCKGHAASECGSRFGGLFIVRRNQDWAVHCFESRYKAARAAIKCKSASSRGSSHTVVLLQKSHKSSAWASHPNLLHGGRGQPRSSAPIATSMIRMPAFSPYSTFPFSVVHHLLMTISFSFGGDSNQFLARKSFSSPKKEADVTKITEHKPECTVGP